MVKKVDLGFQGTCLTEPALRSFCPGMAVVSGTVQIELDLRPCQSVKTLLSASTPSSL